MQKCTWGKIKSFGERRKRTARADVAREAVALACGLGGVEQRARNARAWQEGAGRSGEARGLGGCQILRAELTQTSKAGQVSSEETGNRGGLQD